MTPTLIGIIISAVVSILGFWVKWRLSQAKQDRLRREIAEQEAQGLKEGLKANYEQNAAHEKRILEIVGGVDDNHASELLSSGPQAPKMARAKNPGNGNGRGKGRATH